MTVKKIMNVVGSIILVLLAGVASIAVGAEKSLLEFNILGGVGSLPDYPASNQQHTAYLVLPFVTYRGESFKSDLEGVKADVVRETRVGLDASVSGSFPADSAKNTARFGMPDIDTMIEAGPRLYVMVPVRELDEFRVQLPMRAVFATNFSRWQDRGFLVAPGFQYRHALDSRAASNITSYLAINFGTNRLNSYFYQVDPQFAMADRPQYKARGGYIGSHFGVTYDKEAGQFKFLISIGLDSYKNSSNQASPLHRADFSPSILGGLIFSFYRSDEKAKTMTMPPISQRDSTSDRKPAAE